MNADIHEPEVPIKVVEVQDSLRPPRMHQYRPSLGMHQPNRFASLLDAEQSDEAFGQPVTADDVGDQGLLAEEALLVLVGSPRCLGERFTMSDQIVGMPFQKLQKVLATDLQHVVHEAVEPGLVLERKVTLENHPVEALQCGGDRAPELLDERIHGALLVLVKVKSNHHPVRAPFLNQANVARG